MNPDKNQYKYRLKNFDDKWTLIDASNRAVQYSKIPPGSYVFEVQAANNDGVWGEIYSAKIIRKQAPWLTVPAIIFYFLLLCGFLYYIMSTYLNRKKLELQLYRDHLENEKNEEIHKNQLQFFTNAFKKEFGITPSKFIAKYKEEECSP